MRSSPDRLTLDQARCVFGSALGLAVSVAPAFLAPFGVLAKPMGAELGWSRASLFIAVTIFSGGGVLLSPLAGLLLDRVGARPVALASVLGLPAAVALQAAVPGDYALFLAAATVLAVIGSASHPTVYLSVVVRSFDRRLGVAVALAMAGLGFGQALTGILAQHFLESFGWRGAWLAIAGVVFALGLTAFLIVPWRALPPMSKAEPKTGIAQSAVWPMLVRSPLFWVLAVTLLLILMVAAGVGLNLFTALRDRGFGGAGAASVAAAVPLAAIAGRLLTGALIDRLSYVVIGAALFVGQGVGCVLLATSGSPAAIYLAVALIGLGYGAESDLLPYVIKRRFGATFFGSIYGLMFGVVQIGVMAGPFLAALSFDRSGSYRPAFLAFGCASFLASILWIAARRLPAPGSADR